MSAVPFITGGLLTGSRDTSYNIQKPADYTSNPINQNTSAGGTADNGNQLPNDVINKFASKFTDEDTVTFSNNIQNKNEKTQYAAKAAPQGTPTAAVAYDSTDGNSGTATVAYASTGGNSGTATVASTGGNTGTAAA